MKILQLTQTIAPAGGIGKYVLELLPLLETYGHQYVIIYRSKTDLTPAANGKPIYYIGASNQSEQDLRRIEKIIQREKPTVAYLHAVYNPKILQKIAQLLPTVAFVHSLYPVCPGLGKYFRLGDTVCERPYGLGCVPMIYLRRCSTARHPRNVYNIMRKTHAQLAAYRSLQCIVVASTYMRDILIQNGINATRIKLLPPHFESPRPFVSPQQNPPIVLFSGRLEKEKGLSYLLKALARIQTPYQFVVAGDGTSRVEYEKLAQKLGISNSVQFKGWLDKKELHHFYQQATLLAIPGIWPEPFGKVGIEAMAYGRPVVAFNVGGISDWLEDGFNGFLVPPKDVNQLTLRIEQLLNNGALVAELGANAKQFVEQHYAPKQHLDQLIQILQSVAS